MDTTPWHTTATENLEIAVRWPGGRVPMSLIVDDPMPGLNPMIDHEPGAPHRAEVPNAVLRRFAALAERHGLQGKFSVVPWPLARGRLDRPDSLPPASRAALPEFLAQVRERIAPRFDLTCEFLTHARAIDPHTETPLEITERQWASHASPEDFAATIGLAGRILADAGLAMAGVTSPWDSGQDNEAAYASGVALAAARAGRPVPWYFLHASSGADVLPRIAFRDGRTVTVSVVAGAGTDPGWDTQYGRADQVDVLVDPDGAGRVRDLVEAGLPVVFCTHWQSLYGNGSLGGLHALDKLGERVAEHFGGRVEWVRLGRHAELAAACATAEAGEVARGGDRPALRLTTAVPFPVADVEIRARTDAGRRWLDPAGARLRWNGVPLEARPGPGGAVRIHMPLCPGHLAWG